MATHASARGAGGEKPENIPELNRGSESREVAAKAAGFGNDATYRQATKVVQNGAPELVEAMDKGEITVSAAAEQARLLGILGRGEEVEWRPPRQTPRRLTGACVGVVAVTS